MKLAFTTDEIDALTLDIEGLGLPPEFNFAVLRFSMGAIEDYTPEANINISIASDIDVKLPEFLKSMTARDAEDVLADLEPEPDTPAPKPITAAAQPTTNIAPQADFSPAPMPEIVRAVAQDIQGPEVKTGPWSIEENQHVTAQRAKGVTFLTIASQLNRPIAAVITKHNNTMKAVEKMIAPMLKVKLAKTSANNTGPWTPEEERDLIDQRAKGVAFKVIALKMNRPIKGLTQKFYNLRNAAKKLTAAPMPKPASSQVGKITPATPKLASKAEGGEGVLPHPCPDESWSIEDDLALVSEHHRGLSMLDVSIVLERTKPVCVKRYNALMDAMPAGLFTERQSQLKQTLAHHAHHAQLACKTA